MLVPQQKKYLVKNVKPLAFKGGALTYRQKGFAFKKSEERDIMSCSQF